MSQNPAGHWPILLTVEGGEIVKAAVEGLKRDLDAYAAMGDRLAKSLEGAFDRGKRAALDYEPMPKKLMAIQEQFKKTVENIKAAYDAGAISAKQMYQAIDTAAAAAARQARALGDELGKQERASRTLGSAFNTVSNSLLGFIRAGAAGTAEMNYFGMRMQLINREIASLFKPAIDAALDALDSLFVGLRNLTGEQQRMIGGVALAGVAVLGLATALPRIIAGFQALKAVVMALNVTMAANPILAVIEVLALLLLSTKEGRAAFLEIGKVAMRAFADIMQAMKPAVDLATKLVTTFAKFEAARLTALARILGEIVKALERWGVLVNAETHEQRVGRVQRGEITAEQAAAQEQQERGWGRQVMDSLFPQIAIINQLTGGDAERIRREAQERGRGRQELTPAGGGFEDLGNLYRRLTSASIRTDHQRTVEERLGQIAQNTQPRPAGEPADPADPVPLMIGP